MKKLITSLFILSAIVFTGYAQTGWNNFWVTNIAGKLKFAQNSDTMYVAIQCRNGASDAMCSKADGSFVGMPLTAAYDAGDSVTWRVVKGAALGTSPRVRFINCKTGLYLYQGMKGGTTLVPYMAPLVDTYTDGIKDFLLNDQGLDSGGTYYYYITGNANNEFYNGGNAAPSGPITVKSTSQGWKFVPKKGPQPKTPRYSPTVTITTPDFTSIVGGSINLNIQVTKGANDLLGTVNLYHKLTLLTSLTLDANGAVNYTYPGLIDGVEQFVAVYSGDTFYDPESALLSVVPVPNPLAFATKVILTFPTTSEFSKDALLSIATKTNVGDAVGVGNVYVYVNGLLKNRVAVDALGLGSVTFPNLMVGKTDIKAYYFGDKMAYLNSDTTRVSIDITPTTSLVKPYPVYFDLTCQPVIQNWASLYGSDRGYYHSHSFPQDSIPGITLDSTKLLISYSSDKLAPNPTSDNAYFHFNWISVPLGSIKGSWVNIKTPWLNEGTYNVYVNDRVSSPTINMTNITLDGKSGYYPNQEMPNRWLKAYGNAIRRWNYGASSNNNGMCYLGTVNATTSNIHDLKIFVDKITYSDVSLNLLELIPIEMDSFRITQTAAVNLAKLYYPMFNIGGFARIPGDETAVAYTDNTTLAIPYQVADQTVYGKLTTHVIDTLGNARTTFAYTDYVTVYRKDKWTRMAQGPVDLFTMTFSCDLPDGEYYYQEIDYGDLGVLGAAGRRQFVKDGTFTVGVPQAVNTQRASNIKAYGYNNTLTVKGIQAGAKVVVTDITGRIMVNSISSSDVFTTPLKSSIYIVKVISANETMVTKVLVK